MAINWMKSLDQLTANPKLKKELNGYKLLFHGPPGTGKTMTTKILGKELNRPVFRIDLSMVVSKYVGETEKNLRSIFDYAEHRNWILFFDEGDALFGKRSNTSSSQDRYANQEIAYLLQRMETFTGIVILATNKLKNMDDAFQRRFQSIIYFPKPSTEIRLCLWENAFSNDFVLEDPSILTTYANNYDVSGAEIINIKHFAIAQTIEKNKTIISEEDLRKGLKYELLKKGIIL